MIKCWINLIQTNLLSKGEGHLPAPRPILRPERTADTYIQDQETAAQGLLQATAGGYVQQACITYWALRRCNKGLSQTLSQLQYVTGEKVYVEGDSREKCADVL